MKSNFIDITTSDKIGIITFARNESLNSFNYEMLEEFSNAITEFNNNNDVNVILIKASDKSFAAGIDIKELSKQIVKDSFNPEIYFRLFKSIDKCSKAIVSCVAGYTIGIGFEIALASDIVLAAHNAKFGFPEISFGTTPMFGGVSRLLKTIGKAKASEIVLTGRAIDAYEADSMGIISRIVALADLESEAIKVAKKIATSSPKVIALGKDSIKNAECSTLISAIEYEQKNTSIALLDNNLKIYLTDFLKKNT